MGVGSGFLKRLVLRVGLEGFLNGLPLGADGFEGLGFHGTVKLENIPAFVGQLCTASTFSTLDAYHQRMFEALIHGIHQVPRPAVAEPQLPRGGRDGTGRCYGLQQVHFPRSQSYFLARFDTDAGTAGEFWLFGSSQGASLLFWGRQAGDAHHIRNRPSQGIGIGFTGSG